MYQAQGTRTLTKNVLEDYLTALREDEKSAATVSKYAHDLSMAAAYFAGDELTKQGLIAWKSTLVEQYAAATVNSILAALNGFLKHMGWNDLTVKPLKIQRAMFRDERKELTQAEYKRLVQAAEGENNRRLSLVVQTICATGIRVSELRFITVDAVRSGHTEIVSVKSRRVFKKRKTKRKIISGSLEKSQDYPRFSIGRDKR